MLITREKRKTCQPWYSWKGIAKKWWKKKGKINFHDNLDDDKREQAKESDKIRKKQMRDNFDDNKREQMKENDKIRKKQMFDTLMIIKKGNWKMLITVRKRKTWQPWYSWKGIVKKYEKKERENCVITLMMIKENRLDTMIKR